MKSSTIIITVLLVLLGSAVTYISVTRQNAQKEQITTPVSASSHNTHDMSAMHDMMVTTERAFIEGMIPHHQEAIDTAKEVIARGATTPEIRVLVEGIVTAQESEIAAMQQWYEDWYSTPYQDTGSYTQMMRELEGLSGLELDRAFLEDMIGHHMGAIMMAQSVNRHIEHTEVRELTDAIIETQSAEIELMKRLLGSI